MQTQGQYKPKDKQAAPTTGKQNTKTDWASETPDNYKPDFQKGQIPNMENVFAKKSKPFSAFVPKPADPIKDELAKHGLTEEQEITKVKDLLKELKEAKKESKPATESDEKSAEPAGAISLDLFMKFAELQICKTQE
jgi:hypothetical protein